MATTPSPTTPTTPSSEELFQIAKDLIYLRQFTVADDGGEFKTIPRSERMVTADEAQLEAAAKIIQTATALHTFEMEYTQRERMHRDHAAVQDALNQLGSVPGPIEVN
jgi:hypothetical protein